MRLRFFALAVLAASVPLSAAAQPYGTSTGFPIGDKSRIHTMLDLGMAYDSNSLRFDDDNAPADGQLADWKALIRPGLAVVVPGSSVDLDLRAQLSLMRYLGRGGLSGDDFSETTVGGNVGASLRLGSEDSFLGFRLDNQLVRTPTFIDDPGTVSSDERRYQMWHNRGEALFTLRPGGRALEFDLGYGVSVFAYDSDQVRGLPTGVTHSGIFEARWKFFPKTAFIFHADAGYFEAYNDDADTTQPAIPINVYVGAIGQVTTRLNAELTVGYGDTLSDAGGNFTTRGPIGSAVLTYRFNERTALTIGYRRTIRPEVIFNSVSVDEPFARFKIGFGGRLNFQLYGAYQYRRFGRPFPDETSERASAGIGIADARVEYWFFSWLNSSLTYRLQAQNPEDGFTVANNSEAPAGVFFQDFIRHQVFLNVGFRY